MTDSSPITESRVSERGGWRLAIVLVAVLGMVIAVNHFLGQTTTVVGGEIESPWLGKVAPNAGITLALDDGQGTATDFEIIVPYQPKMNVLEAMQLAATAEPVWQFAFDNVGSDAFLTRIGGLKNDKRSRRYWRYEVNGERANVSFGARRLEPGDHVLWKFAPSE